MRDLRIDGLKGFLIICVLWGHIVVFTTSIGHANQTIWNSVQSWIDTILPVNYFHMVLFFALSILFVKPISIIFIKKRVVTILLPYIFWFLWPYQTALLSSPLPIIQNMLYGNWVHITSILWFLPALFSMNLYYGLYRKYSHRPVGWLWFLPSIIMFIGAQAIAQTYHVLIPFGIDLAIYLFPYLFVMDKIYQHRQIFERLNRWWALVTLPVYAGSIFLINYFEPLKAYTPYVDRIDLAQFSVPFTVVGFVAMTLVSASIFIFFLMVKPSRVMAYIGKYSFPIYLLHLIIIIKLLIIYNQFTFTNPILFVVAIFIAMVLIIGSAIGISKLFVKISPYAKYIGMVE